MADTTIPVLLRVMAERDPGVRAVVEGLERELALAAQAAEQAGRSMSAMDSKSLDRAATSAREVAASVRTLDQASEAARTSLDQVGSTGKQAMAEVASGAAKAEASVQKTERAATGLLAGLRRLKEVESQVRAKPPAMPWVSTVTEETSRGNAAFLHSLQKSQMQMASGLAMGSAPGLTPAVLHRPTMEAAAPPPVPPQWEQNVRKLNSALEEADRRYDQTSRRAVEFGQTAGMSMMTAGAGLAALTGYAVTVAGEFEQLRAKLETVQKSASKAEETFAFARDLAAKTPFDVQGVVTAAVQLEVYGTRAQEVLPMVADLAAGMGKDIESTSLVVGKAMSGSLEGFESLRNEYGISTAKLARYGAVLTSTGGISVQTASDLEKAKNALQAIIKTEFGGAVERQSRTFQGAVSNAGDSVKNLAASWGEGLIPAFTLGAKVFSGAVDVLGAIPGPLKTVGALATAGGAAILVLGGGALMATSALVAMNAQLMAAPAEMAAAATAAEWTGGALTRMGKAAELAKGAFAFFATNPIGLTLTERRRREREAATVTAPVLAPPSRALRLSVVDLAQQVRCLEPSARDLVWDVASLSPERLALLRSVLADAEEVCA